MSSRHALSLFGMLVAALAFLLVGATPAAATDYTWTGAAGPDAGAWNWNAPLNWGGGVPTNTDVAIMGNLGLGAPTVRLGTAVAQNLRLENVVSSYNLQQGTLTLGNAGTAGILSQTTTLTMATNVISGGLEAANGQMVLDINDAKLTISGQIGAAGQVTFIAPASGPNVSAGATLELTNAANNITGSLEIAGTLKTAGLSGGSTDIVLNGGTWDVTGYAPGVAGLTGSYYNTQPTGGGQSTTAFGYNTNLLLTRTDAYVSWANAGAPAAGLVAIPQADYVAGRWVGYVYIPTDQTVTFAVNSDDGCRLLIDGTLASNAGRDVGQGMVGDELTTNWGTIAGTPLFLTAGYHAVDLKWIEQTGGEGVRLLWDLGGTRATLPASNLFIEPDLGTTPDLFNDVVVKGNSTIAATGAANLGNLTMHGGGTLNLPQGDRSGVSFFSTQLDDTTAGTATFNNAYDVAAGPLTMGPTTNSTVAKGGAGTLTFDGITTNNAAATLNVTQGTLRVTGAIMDSSFNPVVLTGAVGTGGKLQLDDETSLIAFGSVINVNGGELQIHGSGSASALGPGAVNLNGGKLTLDIPGLSLGLQGDYYKGHGGTNVATDAELATWTIDNTTLDTTINFPSVDGIEFRADLGWTGYINDIKIHWTGLVDIAAEGNVTFFTNSDDGSKLWIDGTLVVDNDGSHGMREYSGTIFLTEGLHDIDLRFAEGGGGAGCILSYTPVGGAKQVIPSGVLFSGTAGETFFGNDVNVTASSEIETGGLATMGQLTIDPNATLTITGLAMGQVRFTQTNLTGDGDVAFNAQTTLALGALNDNGFTTTITKTGPGDLVLDETVFAGSAAGTTFRPGSGAIVVVGEFGGLDPLGGAAVEMGSINGSLVLSSKNGDVTVANNISVVGGSLLEAKSAATGTATGVTVSLTGSLNVGAGAILNVDTDNGYVLNIDTAVTGGGDMNMLPGGQMLVSGSGSLAGLHGLTVGADSKVTIATGAGLGSSNIIVVEPEGHLDLATTQTNLPVAASGGSISVQGWGALGKELAGAVYDELSADRNVFLDENAILVLDPSSGVHPTYADVGNTAKLYLGVTDMSLTYAGLGDNGEGAVDIADPAYESVYKGVVFSDKWSNAGNFTGILAGATDSVTGEAAEFEIHLRRSQTFAFNSGAQINSDGVVTVTNRDLPSGAGTPTLTLNGTIAGTVPEIRRIGTAPSGSNPGTMGQTIAAFADQTNIVPSGKALDVANGMLYINTDNKRGAVANGGVLNMEAGSTLVLEGGRTMTTGTTNMLAGSIVYMSNKSSWGGYFAGTPTMTLEDGVSVIIDGFDATTATGWPLDVSLNYLLGDNAGNWQGGLKLGQDAYVVPVRNRTVELRDWTNTGVGSLWAITPLFMDGSVTQFRVASNAGNELTIRTNIDMRNLTGDDASRAKLIVGFEPGADPFLPETNSFNYQRDGNGSVRIRQGDNNLAGGTTHWFGDIDVVGGELEFGYNYNPTDHVNYDILSFDTAGDITVKNTGTLTIQGRYLDAQYQAFRMLWDGSLAQNVVIENGAIFRANMRNVNAAHTIQNVDQSIILAPGANAGAISLFRVDEEFRGAVDGSGFAPTDDGQQRNSDGYLFTNISTLDGAQFRVEREHLDRHLLRLDMDLSGTTTVRGDSDFSLRNVTASGGSGTLKIGYASGGANEGNCEVSTYGNIGDGVTIELPRGWMFIEPGTTLSPTAVIRSTGDQGPGGIGEDSYIQIKAGGNGNVAQRLMDGEIVLAGRQDVNLQVNDVDSGVTPLVNELGTKVTVLNQGTYTRNINGVDQAINGWLITGRTEASTDKAVSGRSYYRNVHLAEGATVEIQRNDGTTIWADLFLDGDAGRLVNTNNDNENRIMNITGTGSSLLTVIGTSRTHFGGTMSGANLAWDNSNCFHADDGFRLGGNTVALARAWMDMFSDPGAGYIDLLNATGNNQLYHGRDKYVAGSGDFLYEWGDGTVIVAGSDRELVLHSDSIPLAERGPDTNSQFAPRFVNQFNGTVIVANTNAGRDLRLRGVYRQTDGVNYHGGSRFNDVRLENGAEVHFSENWCFTYMSVSLTGPLGTSGTISNYDGWDGGMWVENIGGNPDIAGDETMYLGGTNAYQVIGQVSGVNLVKTNTNNTRLRPGFDLNGQSLDVQAGWIDWFTNPGTGTILLNVGNQADNTGSNFVYYGGSATDTIGENGWGGGLNVAMSHNTRIMLYNIDEPATAGVANVNKFEAAITISDDGNPNTTDARLSADRGVDSNGIAIGHFSNVTVEAGARVAVQRQEDARLMADLYLQGDISIRSIGDSYSLLTLHSTGDDKLATITKEGGGHATIDLTFDGTVDAFLDSTDTGAIRIAGLTLNGRTFTLARSGTQYTAEMWPSAPDPGAGTIRVEGFFNGSAYEGLGLEIRRGEDGSLPVAIGGATTIEVANGRMLRGFIRENTTQLTQNIQALVHVIADGDAASTDAVLRSRKSDVADLGDVVGLVKFANVMLDDGAKLEVGQQDNAEIQIGGFGDGVVTLLGNATINNTAGGRAKFGDVTGAGALTIQGGQTTFSGVLASAGLNAETDVVIGASALLGLTGPMDVAYGKTLTVNGAGNAAGLTSEGVVDLDPGVGRTIGITGPVANDGVMNVKSGVVDMSTSVMTSTGLSGYVPGLTEGKLAGALNDVDPNSGSNPVPVLSLTAAGTNASPPWADQTTWVYTGEFNWVGGEISIAEHIDDNTVLYVGGVEVFRDTAWDSVGSYYVADLPAGWYQFEVRFGNGGGGAGPNTGNVAGQPQWNASFGFGIKAGPPTLVQADYTFPVDPGDGSLFRTQATLGILNVADGAELLVAGFQGLNSVVLDGTLAITGPTTSVSMTDSLTLGVNGKLDLGMGCLIIDYEAGADVSAILAAYAAGRNTTNFWDGTTGIVSSVVAGDPEHLTAIGIIINEDPNYGGRDTFMGQTVDATSLLIRYTWRGDANLDGAVTADDYDVIDNSFVFGVRPGSTMGWWSGDFNGDGLIDSNDYDWIDNAFVFGTGPLGGAAPVGLGVPEPATMALLGLGLAVMAIRRRSR
jgi:hypothetical protein